MPIMDLDTAVQQRRAHHSDPTGRAQLCPSCGQPWPCAPWRTAALVIIERVRDAFSAAARPAGGTR